MAGLAVAGTRVAGAGPRVAVACPTPRRLWGEGTKAGRGDASPAVWRPRSILTPHLMSFSLSTRRNKWCPHDDIDSSVNAAVRHHFDPDPGFFYFKPWFKRWVGRFPLYSKISFHRCTGGRNRQPGTHGRHGWDIQWRSKEDNNLNFGFSTNLSFGIILINAGFRKE